ncbi:putative p-nitrophenylphosphatase [Leptomonas pyrrhocoris]|uniref:Putative p-nitrophenylphosphatase n=1 Tax=Leptomonas pyrrhocoris TaxID=157538 RepID=A0A0M9FR95_LEPPY|nr:putative p-nitrophenylphosphatase [Leptomonas pyrrhocoris]XP_015652827.1 putative p-nitrophenylphosphatase [Leptomonas pyrrhocoris]KPA74387.1 putative p-nitrophenylphosphatase [Leptomonas pyrrhocoris]KPA74388.1 putative p-nitrophenylphosphatase [Leptomonas pyrrhocoris]|eukprot:XP_015652826.1 putative p-nitrophenylphosphatase [Leptomonas pyrrhocoris]
MPVSVASSSAVVDLCSAVEYLLLDIDGVVWSGDAVLPRIPEALEYLRAQHKQIRFISNNLIYSRGAIARQFAHRGIRGVTTEEIYTVAYASALYLRERFAQTEDGLVHGNVLIVGGPGIHDEVRAVLAPGYTTYGAELRDVPYRPDTVAAAMESPLLPPPDDPRVAELYKGRRVSLSEMNFVAVAVGLDFELNMTKLACAAAVLQSNSNAVFVGTNPDPSDPAGANHVLLPASGAVLAAVTTAIGHAPDVMCGKPSPTLGHLLLEREARDGHRVDPRRMVMIGDRLMTDIQFGKGIGAQTALVLSGAQKLEDVEALEANGAVDELPDLVLNSLADFLPLGAAEVVGSDVG